MTVLKRWTLACLIGGRMINNFNFNFKHVLIFTENDMRATQHGADFEGISRVFATQNDFSVGWNHLIEYIIRSFVVEYVVLVRIYLEQPHQSLDTSQPSSLHRMASEHLGNKRKASCPPSV